jgi:DNA-binding transcriptional regulator GbsR (MarR family)
MNPELEKVRDSFIETMGQLSASLGLSQVVGQLYALLYLSNKPLSLDDMVEILRISKGNASVNIRELERWGAVQKVWVKGSRRDHYKNESDVLKIVLNRLKEGLERRMNNTMDAIDKMSALVDKSKEGPNRAEARTAMIYAEKLNEIKELNNLVKNFLENVSGFIPNSKR